MTGRRFTWERSKGTSNWVEEYLDWAVANDSWHNLHPTTRLINTIVYTSDHTVIFLDLAGTRWKTPSRFCFENAWLMDAECKEVVCNSWEKSKDPSFLTRIKQCGIKLQSWGGDFFSKIGRRIKQCKDILESLREKRDPASMTHFVETEKKAEYPVGPGGCILEATCKTTLDEWWR